MNKDINNRQKNRDRMSELATRGDTHSDTRH